jgi:hypothetical protein
MYSHQISSVLNADIRARRVFRGVFPRDRLPAIVTIKPSIFVINTDTHDRPGLHWVAVSFDSFGYCEYFDSFGFAPMQREILAFIQRNTHRPYTHSSRFLQDLTSSACGLYVIYYALMKSRGQSLRRILRPFSSRCQRINDKKVLQRLQPFLSRDLV